MERVWHEELDAITLPEAARVQAEARFDKPAIFGRRCPRVVDACRREADRLRARGDLAGALAEYQRILELDQSPAMRLEAAKLTRAAGAAGAVKGAAPPTGPSGGPTPAAVGAPELQEIASDEKVPRHVRDRALEEMADAALAGGDGERAAGWYREVASRVVDEDKLRTLDVKMAAAKDEKIRPAIVEQLIGVAGRGPDAVRAAELLGAWAATSPADGLPAYLLARRYVGEGRFAEAAERLDRALGGEIALPRVRTEAERLRLVVACGLGDRRTAERMLAAYVARDVSEARRDTARRLLDRCGASM
jgi:tetratricopeptide (TPR) repeat protein